MADKVFSCSRCDQPEDQCDCARSCALCHSSYGIRLCEDGLYYCNDCRDDCDYRTQEQV